MLGQSFCWIITLVSFASILLVAGYRVIDIQYTKAENFTENANPGYFQQKNLPAERGIIFDSNGIVLATNIPIYSVIADKYQLDDPNTAVDPIAWNKATKDPSWNSLIPAKKFNLFRRIRKRMLSDIENSADSQENVEAALTKNDEKLIKANYEYTAKLLSPILDIPKEEIIKRFTGRQKRIILAKNISEKQYQDIQYLLNNAKLRGISFDQTLKRQYAMPTIASHVIGYTNFENIGLIGIEKSFDSYLRGQDGFQRLARDPRGLPLLSSPKNSVKPPVHGLNIKLTIDLRIQDIAEKELEAGLEEFNAEQGAIVIVEPKTGNVMAMAVRPSFDLNERNMETGALNFAIQGSYEPGSTFKAIVYSAAIDKNKASPSTSVNCEGGRYSIYGTQITDSHPYGHLSLEMALVKSSNIGAFKVGNILGAQAFGEYVKNFGFGKKTGIDLPNENPGALRSTSNPVDFSRITYGYATGATPIQLCMLYSAIANGGKLMRPRLVDSITDFSGKIIDEPTPQITRQVISPSTAKTMREMLAKVTEKGGTATRAQVPGYSVGGKTGTARRYIPTDKKKNITGHYAPGQYVVSFVGMLPAENPAFIGFVVIVNPQKKGVTPYGGTVAAPIFAKIAPQVATILNIPPNLPSTEKKNSDEKKGKEEGKSNKKPTKKR